MDLNTLGWNEFFADHYKNIEFTPARVIGLQKNCYGLCDEQGEYSGKLTGKFHYNVEQAQQLPTVGDWVLIRKENNDMAMIHEVLPRKSKFSRQSAGEQTREQIIAANIDTVFLVSALDRDLNLRRIERYLTLAWESGSNAVIILSKADLASDVEEKQAQVETIAMGIPVIVISATAQNGLEQLVPYLQQGKTVALLGSSGVGKSTLVNALAGQELQKTKSTRSDDKGRHTTTSRELIFLPQGGMIIDTPGMRELQLWGGKDGLELTFEDIEILANQCRYRDCSHEQEPGCAIIEARENGLIEEKRIDNYHKLQKEAEYHERRNDHWKNQQNKKKWQSITKNMRKRRKGQKLRK